MIRYGHGRETGSKTSGKRWGNICSVQIHDNAPHTRCINARPHNLEQQNIVTKLSIATARQLSSSLPNLNEKTSIFYMKSNSIKPFRKKKNHAAVRHHRNTMNTSDCNAKLNGTDDDKAYG